MADRVLVRDRINYPQGYPLILFVNETATYFLAVNETVACAKYGKSVPVDINELTKRDGRQKVHELLKRFGSSWLSRGGMVFYKKDMNGEAK